MVSNHSGKFWDTDLVVMNRTLLFVENGYLLTPQVFLSHSKKRRTVGKTITPSDLNRSDRPNRLLRISKRANRQLDLGLVNGDDLEKAHQDNDENDNKQHIDEIIHGSSWPVWPTLAGMSRKRIHCYPIKLLCSGWRASNMRASPEETRYFWLTTT